MNVDPSSLVWLIILVWFIGRSVMNWWEDRHDRNVISTPPPKPEYTPPIRKPSYSRSGV